MRGAAVVVGLSSSYACLACEASPRAASESVDAVLPQVAEAPLEIVHAGRGIRLTTELRASGKPSSAGDPPVRLVARVRVIARDGKPPPGIDVKRLWLLAGDDAHEAKLGEAVNTKTLPGESVHDVELPGVSLPDEFEIVADVSLNGSSPQRLRAPAQRLKIVR